MKSMLIPISLTFLLICFQKVLSAQEPGSRYQSLDNLIEALTEEAEEDTDMAVLLEELQFLYENPVNINSAIREELLRIPFLNEITAENILEYRRKTGAFMSVFEVAAVDGIGRELAEKLSFFIHTGDGTSGQTDKYAFRGRIQHQLLVKGWQTFPKQAGYLTKNDKPPAFQGGPQKIYTRYLFQQGSVFQAGITGDRDPGEQFFRGVNRWGFDFYSAHLAFRLNDIFPQVIAGDYSVRAGQGLVIWQGFSMGKSSEVLQVSKSMSQIRPYTSTDENFFFRGVATTLQSGNLRSNFFVSHKKSDGNLVARNDGSIAFTSLQNSGYHRTLSEIEDKNSVGHTVAGALLGYTASNIRVGVNMLYERFQYPFERGTQLYQKFLFKGKENYNFSLDYRWISGRYQLFGEAAVSKSLGFGLLQGLDAKLHDQLSMVMVFRHFEKDYHATWSNVFAENSRAINETGFYTGFRAFLASRITLSGYADWFWSPWINYATTGPSNGYEYMIQADVRYSSKLTGYMRFKSKTKADKAKANNLYYDEWGTRNNLRFHIRYQISKYFFLRSRIESVRYSYLTEEHGLMVFQDFGWTPDKPNVSATTRIAWFKTDSYNARIYAYENDLLYNFSTLSFFGEGFRAYLNLRYRISKGLDGWLKIAQTVYSDRDVISSGNSQIDGNSKTDFKIQFRYRF